MAQYWWICMQRYRGHTIIYNYTLLYTIELLWIKKSFKKWSGIGLKMLLSSKDKILLNFISILYLFVYCTCPLYGNLIILLDPAHIIRLRIPSLTAPRSGNQISWMVLFESVIALKQILRKNEDKISMKITTVSAFSK